MAVIITIIMIIIMIIILNIILIIILSTMMIISTSCVGISCQSFHKCLFVCLLDAFVCLFVWVCLKEYLLRGNFVCGRSHVNLFIDVNTGDNEEHLIHVG